jgi:hypothetical protein
MKAHPAAVGRDRGSATAEVAATLPVVVVLLLTGLTGLSAAVTQVRCVDAAREAARAAARGESGQAAGERAAPRGATVSVHVEGDEVRATVRAVVHPLGGRLPGFAVQASAVAALEPDAASLSGNHRPGAAGQHGLRIDSEIG